MRALAQDWLVLFNVEKCKVIHFGFQNSSADLFLDTEKLQTGCDDRDLGVNMSVLRFFKALKWMAVCSSCICQLK